MFGLCFAPFLILGFSHAVQTSWHTSESINAPYAEVQTCRDGLGAHLAASTHPWVAGGVHYGFTWHLNEEWALTIQPKAGLSYSNTIDPASNYRQITRFELGVQTNLCRNDWCGVAGYRHMSNGRGSVETNAGIDLIEFGIGKRFK